MTDSRWVFYADGPHNGRTLWTPVDSDSVIFRRDTSPPTPCRNSKGTLHTTTLGPVPVAFWVREPD